MGPKLKEPSPARRRRVEIMLQGWASFDHQSEIGFISADLPNQIGAFLLDGTRPLSRPSSGRRKKGIAGGSAERGNSVEIGMCCQRKSAWLENHLLKTTQLRSRRFSTAAAPITRIFVTLW
jgi:hypothetical protein